MLISYLKLETKKQSQFKITFLLSFFFPKHANTELLKACRRAAHVTSPNVYNDVILPSVLT